LPKDTRSRLQDLYADDFDFGAEKPKTKGLKKKKKSKKMSKKVEDTESESENEGEERDSSEDEDEQIVDTEAKEDIWQGGTVPMRADATNRVSIVNCDWDHITAADIFHQVKDFLPPTGVLQSVVVYPSEFGKKAMQEENEKGPQIWKEEGEPQSEEDEAESDTELTGMQKLTKTEQALDFEPENYDADDPSSEEQPDEEEEPGASRRKGSGVVSETKFRAYEIRRLRYYYAIATFDSPETANHVYDHLDGFEIHHSGTHFDLRFVPDSMEFNDAEARDRCTSVSQDYVPLKPFVTNALQNVAFTVSWDQDAPIRKQAIARCFSDEVIRGGKDINISSILASSESEDSEVEQEEKAKRIRQKYEGLLEEIRQELPDEYEFEEEAEEGDKAGGEEEEEDEEFMAGFSEDEGADASGEESEEGSGEGSEAASSSAQVAEGEGGAKKAAEGMGDMDMEFQDLADPNRIRNILLQAQATKDASLFEKHMAKKRLERKRLKREKKKFHVEERKRLDEEREAHRDEEAEQLQRLMAPSGMKGLEAAERPKKLPRKESRKLRRQEKVAAAAAERETKRQRRLQLYDAAQRGEDLDTFRATIAEKEMQAKAETMLGAIDQRFSPLLTDAEFAIDPAHHRFKHTDEMMAVQRVQHVEQQKRVRDRSVGQGDPEHPAPKRVALADYVAKFNAHASAKLKQKQAATAASTSASSFSGRGAT